MTEQASTHTAAFAIGERVRIRRAYPIGHCRTPFYARGKVGTIERFCGHFANPEELAYGRDGLPKVGLYRVRIPLSELWPGEFAASADVVEIEIYEHWLERVDPPNNADEAEEQASS